jgi:hypothetical protein
MTVFRIHVHTGRHIELDSKDGIRASEAIQQVLSQSSEDFGSGLTEQDGGHGGKYYLRVRKMVEEGRCGRKTISRHTETVCTPHFASSSIYQAEPR